MVKDSARLARLINAGGKKEMNRMACGGLILISLLFSGCYKSEEKAALRERYYTRGKLYALTWSAKNSISIFEQLNAFLQTGADPNICVGDCGWRDSNPLLVVVGSLKDTYYYKRSGEFNKDTELDVLTLRALVRHGAKISMFPYVWYRVYRYDNDLMEEDREYLKNIWGFGLLCGSSARIS